MKKNLYPFLTLVVLAGVWASCNKVEPIESQPEVQTKEVTLSFASERPDFVNGTKTEFNANDNSIYWSTTDKIRIAIKVDDNWQNASGNATQEKGPKLYVSNEAGSVSKVIDFKVSASFDLSNTGTYKFYGLYPSSATSSTDAVYQYMPSVKITLPAEQSPLAGTFDPTADLMIAKSVGEYTGIPADKVVSLSWTRLVAHGDITLKNLPTFEDGEVIRSITLTAQEGADLVGEHNLNIVDGTITPTGETAKNSIKIKANGNSFAKNSDGNIEFWFASLPFTATSLKAEIKTNKYIYSKQYNGISKKFEVNTRNILGISMSNCSKTDAPAEQLIENGTYVISTKYSDSDLMMVANTGSGNYQNYATLSTAVDNGKIVVDPAAAWILTYNSSDACYYIANADTETELTGSSGSTNLTLTANGSQFYIEECGSGYHIKTSGNDPRWIGYNDNQGNGGRFALYKDDTQFPGVVSITPAKLNATPTLSINNITLPNGAAITSPVEITPSAKKFICTITVNGIYSEASCTNVVNNPWLTVTAANDQLTYTALANETGAGRTLYVSVKGANDDGDETANVVFSVTQPKYVSYSDKWVLVTNVSELAVDDEIVIVKQDGTLALGTTQNTNNRNAVEVTLDANDNKIVNINDNVQQLTLGQTNGNWTLYTGGGYLYAASSSANHLKTQQENDTNGEWSISIDGSSYVASITAQGTNTRNQLKNNGEIFSCYSSGQTAVKIYKYHPDVRPEAPIYWSDDEGLADITDSGVDYTLPTLSNTESLLVTYKSSDKTVATISDSGVVEAISAGTTTISAKYTADANSQYRTTVVEYVLEVTDSQTSSGTDYTTTWTATSGGLGSGIGSGTINTTVSGSSDTQSWSYTRTLSSGSSYTGWTESCIQLGKNGGVENLTLSTDNIPGKIKSVSVECASYQGKHNVSITVGGNTYLGSTATSSWTTVTAKTGTGTSSGTIVISFTGGTRALYIKSITVEYNN